MYKVHNTTHGSQWAVFIGFQKDGLHFPVLFLNGDPILYLTTPLLPIPCENSGTWGEFLAHLGHTLLCLHQPSRLGRVAFDLCLWELNPSVCPTPTPTMANCVILFK